jgi:hypothetical protein
MKVNVNSITEIKATKVISSGDLVLLAKGVAGKKASVDIDAIATVDSLIDAAKIALAIDSTISFAEIFVKRGNTVLDKSKNLSANLVSDGAPLTIVFKQIV